METLVWRRDRPRTMQQNPDRTSEGVPGLRMVLVLAALLLGAAGSGSARAEVQDIRYVSMLPTMVVNYGFVDGGRMKFIRTDIALRTPDLDAARLASKHLPTLRDMVLMLLSRQDDHAVLSADGRQQVRRELLAAMQEFLVEEEGLPCIEDVVFSNFLVQR